MAKTRSGSDLDHTKREEFRFSLKWLFIAVTVVSLLFAAGFWSVHLIHHVYVEAPHDAYATMYGAEAVIGYMRRNHNKWPANWEDLRPIFESMYQDTGAITFDEMTQRLDIDFNVDPAELRSLSGKLSDESNAPFRVIRLRSGAVNYWRDAEPNQMVMEYLLRANFQY